MPALFRTTFPPSNDYIDCFDGYADENKNNDNELSIG